MQSLSYYATNNMVQKT